MISMGFAGQQAPNYGMNNMLLFMRGPDDGQMRVALREGSGIHLDEFRERLRKVLPEKLIPWFTERLQREGHAAGRGRAARPADHLRLRAGRHRQRGHELRLAGADRDRPVQPRPDGGTGPRRRRCWPNCSKIPWLRDVQIQQTLDYPTVPIDIDRQKAGLSGVDAEQVGQSVLVTTSSSRMVARNYWQDPKIGRQLPGAGAGADRSAWIRRPRSRRCRWSTVSAGINLMVRDVATVGKGIMPGEYDRTVHAALSEHHRQRRGRRPGPGRRGRSSRPCSERAQPPHGVLVREPRPGRADERDVSRRWPSAWRWPWPSSWCC